MAPFAAGATVESEAPMQTAQAFAAGDANAPASSTALGMKVLMMVFKE
jgi:hypothetical protein